MKSRLIITYLGNIIDTIASLYLVGKNFIEANPFMAPLLELPWLFIAVKIGVMTLLVVRIWICRASKYAQLASWIAAILYSGISIYYVITITTIILQ